VLFSNVYPDRCSKPSNINKRNRADHLNTPSNLLSRHRHPVSVALS
jgi:hypothetical protein